MSSILAPCLESVRSLVLRARVQLSPLRFYYFKAFRSSRRFSFRGRTYRYFYHRYQITWRDEWTVEVPIIWDAVQEHQGRSILEVGNVLSHYYTVDHDIADKCEVAEGVINQDVVDFQPSRRYDLIVSISTLEHVGWDEEPREPMKALQAIQHLQGLLAPQGKMIVTLPLGYDPNLDRLLRDEQPWLGDRFYLKRVTRDNRWIKVGWEDSQNAEYGHPFPGASALLVGVWESASG